MKCVPGFGGVPYLGGEITLSPPALTASSLKLLACGLSPGGPASPLARAPVQLSIATQISQSSPKQRLQSTQMLGMFQVSRLGIYFLAFL